MAPMTLDSSSDARQKIQRTLVHVANRDKEVQERSLADLKRQVITASRKLHGDGLVAFHKRLRNDISNNLQSKIKAEILGSIRAIVYLVKVEGIDFSTDVNLTMFGRSLGNVLPPFSTDREVVAAACHALGEVAAHFGSTVMAEQFVKRHTELALEWLELSSSRNELKKFAAVLILEVLVTRRPVEFAHRIPDCFDALFKVIHDPRQNLRETGVNVLKHCLMVWRKRAHYPKIYHDIEVGLLSNKEEMIHGSLLAASVFVTYTGDYINDTNHFQSVCDSTIKHFETKRDVVQTALIQLIPQLAQVRRGVFQTYKVQFEGKTVPYFKIAIGFIIKNLSKDRFRLAAIAAVGDLAMELKQNMSPYLGRIIPELQNALDKKFQKGKFYCEELVFAACHCIAKLVQALGKEFSAQAAELLNPLFESGLSEPLVKTLQSIAIHIPRMDAVVQRRTLNVLSLILQNKKFQHPGYTKSETFESKDNNGNGVDAPARQDLVLGHDAVAAKVLALYTLRTFNFRLHSLTKFAHDCVAPLMFHENPEVREAACTTAAAILVLPCKRRSSSRDDISKVSAVILKLLTAGISDRKSRIRCAVINSLGPHLEKYLAKVEVLKMLFVCLYDNNLDTRLAAVGCVGKLCSRNPAYVMPALSKLLVQLLNDLHVLEGAKAEVTSMKLLIKLIQSAPRVIHPYVDAVVASLRLKLSDTDSSVFELALCGMGEVARVNEEVISTEVPALMNVILEVLTEQSLESRKASAVCVLGQITRSTGYVIQPYEDFPTLMSTLFGVLEEAQSQVLKMECIKVFGILGALDPYQEKMYRLSSERERGIAEGHKQSQQGGMEITKTSNQQSTDTVSTPLFGSEEHFMDLVVSELMVIAYDTSLIHIHVEVIRSCGILVVKAGVKTIPYLPQLVPAFIHMVKSCNDIERFALINELAKIIAIFGVHLRVYVSDIIDLIIQYWLPIYEGKFHPSTPRMHSVIMGLLKALVKSLGDELRPCIPRLVKHCMAVFQDGAASGYDPIYQVLEAMRELVDFLGELLPSAATCTVIIIQDFTETPLDVRKAAVMTLNAMARKNRLGLQSTSILVALCGVIKHDEELRNYAFKLLMTVIQGMGRDYVDFGHQRMVESMLNEVLPSESFAEYLSVVKLTLKDPMMLPAQANKKPLPAVLQEHVNHGETNATTQEYLINLAKEAIGISSKFDVDAEDWMTRLIKMVYKESSTTAIAACQNLAEAHPPFARKVFKAAFSSCWTVLDDAARSDLVEGLERIMEHSTICMQLMLNVAEFMSHYGSIEKLFSDKALGKMGLQCHTYAKALKYKEIEFSNKFNIDEMLIGQRQIGVETSTQLFALVEDMIRINQSLQEPEAARGVMAFVRSNIEDVSVDQANPGDDIIPPSWYEKLDEWDKALGAYENRLSQDPQDFNMALGRMRCLDNLGKWQELHDLVEGAWPHATVGQRKQAALMACSAAAGLGVWDALETYISALPDDIVDRTIYNAMFAIHKNDFKLASECVAQAREQLGPTLISLWQESYSRGHTNMVKVQMLAELDEVSIYKQSDNDTTKSIIRRTWSKRMEGCQYNLDVWLPLMKVRSLVLDPRDDPSLWLDYCRLCRKQGESSGTRALGLERSRANLVEILGFDPQYNYDDLLNTDQLESAYAYIKYMWESYDKYNEGIKGDAPYYLVELIKILTNDQEQEESLNNDPLLATCYHKLGQWQRQEFKDNPSTDSEIISNEKIITEVLESFNNATHYDPSWYKAWHAWAFMSYEAVSYFERNRKYDNDPEAQQEEYDNLINHVNNAITGFFNSIGLCETSNLQDTLRLLTLWFKYGGDKEIAETIRNGVEQIHIDTWVQVIPQLIARIQIADPYLRSSIHDILLRVGRSHSQALVFPLTVASHNSDDSRRMAAELLMNKICEHSAELVEQARLVSKELIRVAVLFSELWVEGLDEAGRHYTDKNYDAMMGLLEPLHDKLASIGSEELPTASETEFLDAYGADLHDAWEKCERFKLHNNRKDLEAAWDHYHQVYRMISRSLPVLTSLDLQNVSPKLNTARDLQLAVPGTYLRDASNEPVFIQSFIPRLSVISSKQRPRKFGLVGTDGKTYQYLLKAHEDIRQDERVMQLFGLVNTLLNSDSSTAKRLLEIKTYFVMPLSQTSGLIEWVPTADTLHGLVRAHRERIGMPTNQEVRLMIQMTPDYDKLSVIQKVEVFRKALSQTKGDDIAQVMWLQSQNAELWLERRTTYIRTLAVMSMVGYVLGLGDRHPSNLMLDRISGSIMHVDFGDCFEVAINRPKFPERVPFRLTRMLIKAMEVSGIEGTYRITCENVMRVLRSNSDSLIAVLEAFVYDPLIDWFVKLNNGHQGGPNMTGFPDASVRSKASGVTYDEESQFSDEPMANGSNDLNSRAMEVLGRIKDKLSGNDFNNVRRMEVPAQVRQLINDATNHENLCQHYTGWCSFW